MDSKKRINKILSVYPESKRSLMPISIKFLITMFFVILITYGVWWFALEIPNINETLRSNIGTLLGKFLIILPSAAGVIFPILIAVEMTSKK